MFVCMFNVRNLSHPPHSLFLARLCKQAQYRVIYTSTASTAWAGARFSRAIDKFYLVPRSHEDYEVRLQILGQPLECIYNKINKIELQEDYYRYCTTRKRRSVHAG